MPVASLVLAVVMLCPVAATATPVLHAVAGDDNEPFNLVQDQQLQGQGVDVAKVVAERAGMSLDLVALPWARALATARLKPDVLLLTVARTAARESQFYWLGPIAKREVWLWKLRQRHDIRIDQASDVRN
jgi:polar amino acid transport system substrate-binding protein